MRLKRGDRVVTNMGDGVVLRRIYRGRICIRLEDGRIRRLPAKCCEWMPSEADIARLCLRINTSWTPYDEWRHRHEFYQAPPYEVPTDQVFAEPEVEYETD